MTPEEERSLRAAIAALERLSRFSSEHGRPMLASLIEIARAEAEDELKTELESGKRLLEFKAGAVATSLEADLKPRSLSSSAPNATLVEHFYLRR